MTASAREKGLEIVLGHKHIFCSHQPDADDDKNGESFQQRFSIRSTKKSFSVPFLQNIDFFAPDFHSVQCQKMNLISPVLCIQKQRDVRRSNFTEHDGILTIF